MWSIVYLYMMDYYSAIRKDEIQPFVTTWMDLEGIMLSEISQREKIKYHMISLITKALVTQKKVSRSAWSCQEAIFLLLLFSLKLSR
uniref:DUF1725 domain-containing protein n=1 Tax=Equus asinus asinus TaxID=83772 RepID=A0A8C4M6U2_EQUAS